jgi:cobalt-zinc-cadmium efflux system outer membrane protein
MTARIAHLALFAALTAGAPASAQAPDRAELAERYLDPVNGLSLEEAVARALRQTPSIRAARSEIDVARGMRLQASLRSNPTVSFERREEPAGTDSQIAVSVEWPLELFRRSRRVAVADREVTAAQLAVADRERLLAIEVRTRYGEVAAAVRDLVVLDELVAATTRQHDTLRARIEEGAAAPLERDLLEVELQRLASDRMLRSGRTEAALFDLKRVLGMSSNAALTLRDALEDLVQRDSLLEPAIPDTPAALERRADVREAAARVDVADAKIERIQAENRFDLNLSATYMRMDAGFPQRTAAFDGRLERVRGVFHYVSAGATISVPVLDRGEGEVAAARAERAGAMAAHQAARLAADSELAAARTRVQHTRQALNAHSSGARILGRQNLAVVSQSYDLGRLTVFDVLAEQRRYLEVERSYTDALKAAYEAGTALDLALGGVR